MGRRILLFALFVACLAQAASAQNLLVNGDFEKGLTKDGEPVGWHSRITGYITVSEYKDPEHKKGLISKHFKDGCGYDWGAVRPWVGLFCPQCKQMITTEESSAWYTNNFKCVSLGPGRSGKGAVLTMDKMVAENQGVRLCSDFVRAERGAGYEISIDAVIHGGALKGFVECFQIDDSDEDAKAWAKTLPKECNPYRFATRLKRSFRQQLAMESPGSWKTFREQFVVPQNKYRFDVMYVSLYAYAAAGEAGFDNVVLRKLSPTELARYYHDNPPSKDERFR